MYNKLFTKILDSSIWLEPTTTRIVWLTLIAAMDEQGFAQFASVANVAHRAIVTLQEAEEAMRCLESPDPNSSDETNEGRRIERVPGGWLILNAEKHRMMVTKAIIQEQTAERVRKYRAKRSGNAPVTQRNAPVTQSPKRNETVTPSEAVSKAEAEKKDQDLSARSRSLPKAPNGFEEFWALYPKRKGKGAAQKAWTKQSPPLEAVRNALAWQIAQPEWTKDGGQFIPHPATWLNQRRWEDEPFHLAPKAVPSMERTFAWRDECDALHGGRCGSREFHAAVMAKDAE